MPRPPAAHAVFTPGARLYTVAEADRTLPYVRRVVADLVRDHDQWRRCLAALDADRRNVRRPDEAGDLPEDSALVRRMAARLSTDVQAAQGELAALGVECKGVDVGLVDFPSEMDGAPAFLCWQLGEARVAWWHRPDAGFAGRQPIPGAGADVAAEAGAPGVLGTPGAGAAGLPEGDA